MTSDLGDESARLRLPYLAAGQMQKHVTLNEALTRLDLLVQSQALSRTVTAQPADPPQGAIYILPEDATGDYWSLFDAGDLVRHEAAGWTGEAAPEGMLVHVADEDRMLVRSNGEWRSLSTQFGELQAIDRLGVNAEADVLNPVVLKVPKVLLTAVDAEDGGDGDLRLMMNKQTVADVASLLFQSGFEGRAEIGLIGDDDLVLKTSADGVTWTEALRLTAATGAASFGRGALRAETTVFSVNGTYAVPAWAKRLEVTCIAGGGGGGSGFSGAASTNRCGGGGGGAGGRVDAILPVASLTASLTVIVGPGGNGGAGVTGGGANAGAQGIYSEIRQSGLTLLSALGGAGGPAGAATVGLGGRGGLGDMRGNSGGVSSLTANGGVGEHDLCPRGPGAGGAGGSVNSANVARGGGAGGDGFTVGGNSGSAPGASASAVGATGLAGADATGLAALNGAGGGAAGGGSTVSTHGGSGGAGGVPGGGGGGGAAARDTVTSGSGGAGGYGQVRITAVG